MRQPPHAAPGGRGPGGSSRPASVVLLMALVYGAAVLALSIGGLVFLFGLFDGGFSWPGFVLVVIGVAGTLAIHRWMGWAPFRP